MKNENCGAKMIISTNHESQRNRSVSQKYNHMVGSLAL